jgi:hypothetical protein
MSRGRQALVALVVAAVVGGTIGWLFSGGNGSSGAQSPPSSGVATSTSVGSPSTTPPSAQTSASSSDVSTSTDSGLGSPSSSSPETATSDLISAGAVTVTASPSTAKAYQAIEVSGTVEGAPPGTTLQFVRKGGAALATTQVGRAGAYRLTVKIGRSGTFVVQTVDGATVLATSAPFALTVH